LSGSENWRFRQTPPESAGKASGPRQLLLRCSNSCIHAVVLTLLTYIHVGNATSRYALG